MGWTTKLEIDGMQFVVTTDCFLRCEIVGFNMSDEPTLKLLRAKDTALLETLGKLPDLIDDFSRVMWAGDGYWWDDRQHNGVNNYLRELQALLYSQYATGEQKDKAREEIRRIDAEAKAKAEKKKRSKRRRSQFSAKRDAAVLALIERDGYECQECGTPDDLTIDHIKPLSKGGSDDLGNLRWLCRSCNSKKGDRE